MTSTRILRSVKKIVTPVRGVDQNLKKSLILMLDLAKAVQVVRKMRRRLRRRKRQVWSLNVYCDAFC